MPVEAGGPTPEEMGLKSNKNHMENKIEKEKTENDVVAEISRRMELAVVELREQGLEADAEILEKVGPRAEKYRNALEEKILKTRRFMQDLRTFSHDGISRTTGFDLLKEKRVRDWIIIADRVGEDGGRATDTVSYFGTNAYSSRAEAEESDKHGFWVRADGEPREFINSMLSPKGKEVLLRTMGAQTDTEINSKADALTNVREYERQAARHDWLTARQTTIPGVSLLMQDGHWADGKPREEFIMLQFDFISSHNNGPVGALEMKRY